MHQEDASIVALHEEIKQVIANNEAISATDSSVKDGNMAGVWKIEDLHEYVSTSNIVWSRSWRKNTVLAAEAEIVFDLAETIVNNMRGYDEGKINIHPDCRKVWDLLTADELKSIQFTGDRGSIASKIIELESKTKIKF